MGITEQEAWEYLEDVWTNHTINLERSVGALITVPKEYRRTYKSVVSIEGLCASLDALRIFHIINHGTYLSMINRLESHKRYIREHYLWPRNKRGARARALFCRKQATVVSKEKELCSG